MGQEEQPQPQLLLPFFLSRKSEIIMIATTAASARLISSVARLFTIHSSIANLLYAFFVLFTGSLYFLIKSIYTNRPSSATAQTRLMIFRTKPSPEPRLPENRLPS